MSAPKKSPDDININNPPPKVSPVSKIPLNATNPQNEIISTDEDVDMAKADKDVYNQFDDLYDSINQYK